ncbi:hypothetical protein JCM21714_4310 [Gracilibacillus boraciitolerans JCM 21714]|uniref:Uncharacterized protein n=1 Tax=Gracilibacillus boraciitolerans JCM 21714 TaxID=1298598 RepID=W4VPL1_9BACI|nr:hypothetical protein [Gracilibacillus boraciitolerans]GAE95101.1 hypothetical protein JCM21714_4310 [Gracilibacillus boraciitolerans JCM 21714]
MPIASRFKNLKQVQEKEQLDQGILLDKENITMAAVTRVNADNFETFHVLPHLKEVDQSKWMVTQDQDQIDQLIPLFDQEI